MKYGLFGFILVVATVAGCSTAPTAETLAIADHDDPGRGIYCKYESQIGSAVRQKHCTTPEQREADRQQAEHVLTQPGLGGPGRRGAGM